MSTLSGRTLAVVGRGRAATALVPRWQTAGLVLVDQRSRKDGDVASLRAADVVVLAVPDDALKAVAAELAQRPSAGAEVWLHLSGSRPASVVRVTAAIPRAVGGLHPLVALADANTRLEGRVAGLDGEPEALVVAEALARAVGLTPMPLTASGENAKVLYHAAAVTVAGHATALFAQALSLMAAAGVDAEVGRRALWPLFQSAVENLGRGMPADVLTGPIARGDVDTVRRHLAAITDPDIRATYRLLASCALGLVGARLPPEHAADLAALLVVSPSGPSL